MLVQMAFHPFYIQFSDCKQKLNDQIYGQTNISEIKCDR
jgi:hypothetical protein